MIKKVNSFSSSYRGGKVSSQKTFISSSTKPLNLSSSKYINRELALISFNERVLAMSELQTTPILEKLNYLCIVSSNLDELFEIRVAGLKARLMEEPSYEKTPDGLNTLETLKAVRQRIQILVKKQYEILNFRVLPSLTEKNILVHTKNSITQNQMLWAKHFFLNEIFPILTPIGLDPAHPFPRVLNKSLNFIVEMNGKDSFGREGRVAILQAPKSLPRLIKIPEITSPVNNEFIMLSVFVEIFSKLIFPGMEILGVHQFRLTRNSDLFVDEEEITDLRKALRGGLSQRNFGAAVRLEVSKSISSVCLDLLIKEFNLSLDDCYMVDGPVNLSRLIKLPELVDKPLLKFPVFFPDNGKFFFNEVNLFERIKKEDILLHHPYQSFNIVTDFINSAANDPNVVAISQTIYRTGNTSELMQSLLSATKKGKEVTVVVELMARFDEETNINWASQLEEAGAHVIFGVVGNKTHAKMCLIVRKESGQLRRYVHLGTGNYHPTTAKLYTDFGLLTANEKICSEVHKIFHQLTGLGTSKPLRELWQSPFKLHSNVIKAINTEIKHAQNGRKARIIARMNSLVEIKTINALYKASQNGVKIDLIVRGVCMLRPGVSGLSENITVRSTIGRFLEHSRIFFFKNDGADNVYLSSADWMDRNFFRRVEIAFPIFNNKLKKRVINEGLLLHLKDNNLSWKMKEDGSYKIRRNIGNKKFSCQDYLLSLYTEKKII